ncbi:hypothetical protein BGZ65_001612, partial [Modicella reniformis]
MAKGQSAVQSGSLQARTRNLSAEEQAIVRKELLSRQPKDAMQSTNPTEHTEFSIRVRIHVLQARGLAVKDSNGMSDPYVKIRIGGHSFTTQYIPKTLNPVWDASFEFDIETQSVPDQVNLMFWDKDRFTKDDFMGVARWYELKTLPGKPSNVSGE